MQSKSGIFGEKFNEASQKKGFPFAKDLHRNKFKEWAKVRSFARPEYTALRGFEKTTPYAGNPLKSVK
ncbi:MAG: hypothetical protein KF734_05820 [Saprospiraceae bacterium]|nr:hypothetical protein [Saprospiraceae bacterium]